MPRKKKYKKRIYTDVEKMAVVVQYSLSLNMVQVAKDLGLERNTIKNWPQQDWWAVMVAENRQTVSELVEAKLNHILNLSHDRVISSLTEGDEKLVVDPKTREHVIKHVMPSGKESATIGGITFDKLRILNNQPTTIKADSGNMIKLMEDFRRLSRSYEAKRVSSIEGEAEEVE